MKISDTLPIELIADEGHILTNGEIYSPHVILSNIDSPDNWQEILLEEVPMTDEQFE